MNNKEMAGGDATISSTINGFAFAASDGNPRTTQFNNTSEGGKKWHLYADSNRRSYKCCY